MLRQRWQFLIPLLLFLGLCIFLWRGLSVHSQQLPSPFINKPVPAFALPDLMQKNQMLTDKELHGHISLLNVWATWCINCRLEHPVLVDISNNTDILIYGLNYKDSSTAAKNWLKQYGNPYQKTGVDQQGLVAINFGVYGTPETFVIDKKGIIRYKVIGPVTTEVWQQELKPFIDKLRAEE